MAGFQSEHAGTYFIARVEVEPPKELLDMVFPKLNYWLRQPTEDIATKSFLNYWSIFGWSFYKTQYCYEHDILSTLYGTFQSSVIQPRALMLVIETWTPNSYCHANTGSTSIELAELPDRHD
ncbi:hypothetical protein E4U23_006631 [Claviceps purpurea]|nr:hypothetical protein E4U23_006631 [Claviceps purpurea]